MDWIRILTDPDPLEMARLLRVGQFVTWPKLHIIENRLRLERQIYLGRQATKLRQQGPSSRTSKEPLPPTSVGHQNSVTRGMISMAEESDDDDFDTRTLGAPEPEGWAAPPQPAEPEPSTSNNASGSFLSRLRTQSFPGLTSPIRRKGTLIFRGDNAGRDPETSGSSDSSSTEDRPSRQAYHPTVLRNRPDVRQVFPSPQDDGDGGSDGDHEYEDL